MAIIYAQIPDGLPAVAGHLLSNLPALPRVCVLLTLRFLPVPYLPEARRFLVKRGGLGVAGTYRVVARYGYMEAVDHGAPFVRRLVGCIARHVAGADGGGAPGPGAAGGGAAAAAGGAAGGGGGGAPAAGAGGGAVGGGAGGVGGRGPRTAAAAATAREGRAGAVRRGRGALCRRRRRTTRPSRRCLPQVGPGCQP